MILLPNSFAFNSCVRSILLLHDYLKAVIIPRCFILPKMQLDQVRHELPFSFILSIHPINIFYEYVSIYHNHTTNASFINISAILFYMHGHIRRRHGFLQISAQLQLPFGVWDSSIRSCPATWRAGTISLFWRPVDLCDSAPFACSATMPNACTDENSCIAVQGPVSRRSHHLRRLRYYTYLTKPMEFLRRDHEGIALYGGWLFRRWFTEGIQNGFSGDNMRVEFFSNGQCKLMSLSRW